MATTLTDFLLQNLPEHETLEVTLPRMKGVGTFKIKPMTAKQFYSYQKTATNIQKKGSTFDTERFNMNVVVNHTVEPNFKEASFIEAAGVTTAEALVNKVLKGGEVAELSRQISILSGFDEEGEDLVEEVKNS